MTKTIPQPGDFGLVSIQGGVGLGIRIGQWLLGDGFRNYEHAFIYVGDANESRRIIEAEPGGAVVCDLSEYAGRDILWSSDKIKLTDEQRVAIVQAARQVVGTPYSFLDYLSLALVRFHLRPKFVVNRIKSSKHLICSQLVDRIYNEAGVQLFDDGRFDGDVTPGDLTNILV